MAITKIITHNNQKIKITMYPNKTPKDGDRVISKYLFDNMNKDGCIIMHSYSNETNLINKVFTQKQVYIADEIFILTPNSTCWSMGINNFAPVKVQYLLDKNNSFKNLIKTLLKQNDHQNYYI